MRELTPQEVRRPTGGRSRDFYTIVRHDIPRWTTPPNAGTTRRERRREAAPTPIPLRWLPPNEEWPGAF